MYGNIPRLFFCSSSGGHLITNLEYGPYCLPNISPLSIAPQNKHNPPRHSARQVTTSTSIPLALFPIEALQRTAVFTRSADPSPP